MHLRYREEQVTEQTKEQIDSRIEALERERAELFKRTNETVAAAQERLYWLDRWRIDLNTLMRKPGAKQFRNCLRALKVVTRSLKRLVKIGS